MFCKQWLGFTPASSIKKIFQTSRCAYFGVLFLNSVNSGCFTVIETVIRVWPTISFMVSFSLLKGGDPRRNVIQWGVRGGMNAVKCSEICNNAPQDRQHPGLPLRATHAGREAGEQTDRPNHKLRKQTSKGKNGEFNIISYFLNSHSPCFCDSFFQTASSLSDGLLWGQVM